VLIECLTGSGSRDAASHRLLRTCDVIEDVSRALARRAARLRTQARRGSAIDALVVAVADPGGTVWTSDPGDLRALAAYADDVAVEVV
jgi:predicted nucleic acid-binding protein